MQSINRIQKRKVTNEIVDELKRLIQEGVFTSDSKLPPEKELSDMFGVGRSSVREALSMLSAAQIIETRQGEGTFVRKTGLGDYIHPLAVSMIVEKQETLNLLETRKIVETGTAELAALRADEHDLAVMRQTLQDLERQLAQGETGWLADFAFHRAVAEASKNPVLVQIIDNLSKIMKLSLEYTLSQNTGKFAERRKLLLQEHKAIFACIEQKDPKGAAAAMQYHLEQVRKKLV